MHGLGVFSSECSSFAFDQTACTDQLQRAPFVAGRQLRGAGRALEYINAGTSAHFHPAVYLQRNQRLAHRWTAYTQDVRQITLGWQAVPGL